MAYIAFGMVVVKLLLDLSVFLVKKINVYHSEQANSDEASCIFCHELEGKDVCVNILFSMKNEEKYMP